MKRYLALALFFATATMMLQAKKLDENSVEVDDQTDKEFEAIKPVELINPPLEFIKGTLYGCSALVASYIGTTNFVSGLRAVLYESQERHFSIALRLITAIALFEMAATKGSESLKSFGKIFS